MAERGKGSPRSIGIAIAVLLVLLIGVVAAIGLETVSLARRLDGRNETLMSTVRDNTASLDLLRQSLHLLARDSNEVRDALNLPAHDYPVLSDRALRATPSGPQESLLDAFDLLVRSRDRQVAKERVGALATSPALRRLEVDNDLTAIRSEDGRLLLTRGNRTYFTVAIDPVSERLRISDALGTGITAAAIDGRAGEFVDSRSGVLDRHFARLNSALETLRTAGVQPSVRETVLRNGLSISAPEPVDGGYRLLVRRAGATLLTVTLNATSLAVTAGNRPYRDAAAFLEAFPAELEKLDRAAAGRQRVAASRRRIESLRGEKTFMLALSARRIAFSTSPREDIDYFYYDFTDSNGARIGSFAVQKKLGTIYLMDGNGLTIGGLASLGTGTGTATGTGVGSGYADGPRAQAPRHRSDDPAHGTVGARSGGGGQRTDFLICGAHQNETDTIIVVHADRARGTVTLIGIPRDLYYKGRKINAVYELYGPQELTREISEITGLPIHNYVVIDMYAFIDVINILGGIDLYLEAPLVDPSYRVWDGGGWSTLSYGPGMHHLDGIAALRIARSRNTSSDFVRAYRQQDLLSAIRRKIDEISLLDLSKLSNLAGVFFRYVDTDFTPSQIVELLLTYRNVPVAGNYVIDTENVLYQTYTNIYYLDDGREQLSDGLEKGAWILLPRDDDWNVIQSYVHRILGGDAS